MKTKITGRTIKWLAAIFGVLVFAALVTFGSTSIGSLSFTNTPLPRPDGGEQPQISIAADGMMAMVAAPPFPGLGTPLWTGPFGATPTFQGIIDAPLQQPLPGKTDFGGVNADAEFGSTGTLHATTLIVFFDPTMNRTQLGVSAIACTNAVSSFNSKNCTAQIIDRTSFGFGGPWITSDGLHVYISHLDSANSRLTQVHRSDDDGFTWQSVGDPTVGQGGLTADTTFDTRGGPMIADRFTHNIYMIYAGGVAGIQKAKNAVYNNIFISRSTDGGMTWTAIPVFQAPPGMALDNWFPTLAVDPINGKLHAAWSDAHIVFYSTSSNQGMTWSPPVAVNTPPANTAIFPSIAAYNGTVDVVYYGTIASSKDDPSALWNVYLAQTTNDGVDFTQSRVSNTPNHVGVICTLSSCPSSSGNLDMGVLFEVAIDPQNGKAAVIYTDDDTLSTGSSGNPMPQVVLAQQQ